MNTNDPQAPYTVKMNGPVEADRTAPLLSEDEREAYYDGDGRDPFISLLRKDIETLKSIRPPEHGIYEGFRRGAKFMDLYWREKIASGELRVVKTTTACKTAFEEWVDDFRRTACCDEIIGPNATVCPVCAAKIIEG
jgi:hypothetical protein